jgi:predicted dehydrogenase
VRMRLGMAGLIGHTYVILGELGTMDEVELVAVASDDSAALEKLRAGATAPKGARYYATTREMLAAEKLDVLAVCNTDGERAETIIAGAEKGCHVIAEKPLARTLKELDGVRAAVGKAGIQLTMLMTMRFEPIYMAARKVMMEGHIGEAAQITAQKSYKLGNRPEWVKSRKSFSGVIPFVGIHMVDLMRWISGREFVEAMAYGGNTTRPQIREMEDNASAVMKMDNGGSATLRVDYLRPQSSPTHGDDRIRIAGSKGVLEARGAENLITVITEGRGVWTPDVPQAESLFHKFIKSLGGGEAPVSVEDCYRTTEICLLMREAQDTGRIVSLKR